jgi:hypothetical protein
MRINRENPERADYVRGPVTIALIVAFILLLAFAGFESAKPPNGWTQVKEYLNIALPAITALLGSAMGFYFGTSGRATNAGAPGPTQPPGSTTTTH